MPNVEIRANPGAIGRSYWAGGCDGDGEEGSEESCGEEIGGEEGGREDEVHASGGKRPERRADGGGASVLPAVGGSESEAGRDGCSGYSGEDAAEGIVPGAELYASARTDGGCQGWAYAAGAERPCVGRSGAEKTMAAAQKLAAKGQKLLERYERSKSAAKKSGGAGKGNKG